MATSKKSILEVCAFHIESCIIAERAGAARVELCDNPIEGGTNPSYGTIKQAREKISILLYPILRPRSGNYYYSDEEFAILKDDIAICRELGCDGISVGIQDIHSRIDMERFKRIKEWAYVGCGIKYISALIGHLAVDGPVAVSFSPLVIFGLLLISYFTYHQLLKFKSNG